MDIVLHLRVPFSWVLAPVFLFAAYGANHTRGFWVAAVCQLLLLYPASHAFNSYYDRDTGPIGGLENPPPVSTALWWVSALLNLLALVLAALGSGIAYMAWVAVYVAASTAYSHPAVRWKARPWWGWAVVSGVQGGVGYVMTLACITGRFLPVGQPEALLATLVATVGVAAGYPLTQIYQHAEDRARGDTTASLRLGVRGTLLVSLSLGAFTALLFTAYVVWVGDWVLGGALALGLFPVGVYSVLWGTRLWYGAAPAYRTTMRPLFWGATVLNAVFAARIVG